MQEAEEQLGLRSGIEFLDNPLVPTPAHCNGQLWLVHQSAEGFGQGVQVARWGKQPSLPIVDLFDGAAFAYRNHRQALRHRLEYRQTEWLLSGRVRKHVEGGQDPRNVRPLTEKVYLACDAQLHSKST
jgi:hypothetical protein